MRFVHVLPCCSCDKCEVCLHQVPGCHRHVLQVGSALGVKATVPQIVQQVLQEGGLSGFYRGYGIGVLRAVPMSGLSFGTYELVRAWLAVQSGIVPARPQFE